MSTVTVARETCRYHPDGCRDTDRHPLPVRVRADVKREMAARVAAGSARTVNAFAEEAIEARAGLVHCQTCHETVPLAFGDLTGRTLDEWIADAVMAARGQECRAHQPVAVGAKAAVPAPAPAVDDQPPGPTLVFQAPGARPVVTSPVPEPAGRKKGRK